MALYSFRADLEQNTKPVLTCTAIHMCSAHISDFSAGSVFIRMQFYEAVSNILFVPITIWFHIVH